jgi:hypothetical protein
MLLHQFAAGEQAQSPPHPLSPFTPNDDNGKIPAMAAALSLERF